MPFLPVGLSGGGDTDHFDRITRFVFIPYSVHDQQHHVTIDNAKRMPALFSIVNAVCFDQAERIGKGADGGFETDTVFA